MKTAMLLILPLLAAAFQAADSSEANFNMSCKSVYAPGTEVTVNFSMYSYYGEKDRASKVKVDFTLYRIRDVEKFYSNQTSYYTTDIITKDTLSLVSSLEKIESFNRTFSQKSEYGYGSINEEMRLNVSSRGAYLLKAVIGNKVAYCGFFISNLNVISKAGVNTMAGYAGFRNTGMSAKDARMEFYLGNKKVSGAVASNGSALINFDPNLLDLSDESFRPLVIAYSGEDIAVSDSYSFFRYNDNRYETYIFTDQPVYRAGSVVNFKGTARIRSSKGYENIPNADVTIVVKDPNGSDVYKTETKTNNNGSFSATFQLDAEAKTGDYSIEATIKGAGSNSTFTVEQFKKPEYKVSVAPSKGQYYGNDVLNAEISADYFFGSPVQGANVEYEIHKVGYYRPWWMYGPYADWYRDSYEEYEQSNRGSEFIYRGEGVTGSDGKLDITYNINEDFKSDYGDFYYRYYYGSGDYRYIITARVTDKARHSVSGSSSVYVTRSSFTLAVNASSYIYKPGDGVTINVNASDYSDKPVSTDFNAYIYKYDIGKYDNENKTLVTVINGQTRQDGSGSVVYQLPASGSEGSYVTEVKATDDAGHAVTEQTYFYVSSGDYSWLSSVSSEIQIITDKSGYSQGDILRAVIVAPASDVDIFITTETADIVTSTVKRLSGTSLTVEFPITDEYFSGFNLYAAYTKLGTVFSSNKKIPVIPRQKLLTVLIEPSKLIYTPREDGGLRVRILDSDGNPVKNAEVSLGIVDESIYSIKPDKTRNIDKIFYGGLKDFVSTSANNESIRSGYSRQMTIYEKFRMDNSRSLGRISGRVSDLSGNPVEGAAVMIDKDYLGGVTNENGEYVIRLPEGSYTVGLKGFEGTIQSKRVSVQSSRIARKDFAADRSLLFVMADGFGEEGSDMNMEMDAIAIEQAPGMEMRAAKEDAKQMSAPEKDGGYAEATTRSDFRDAILWLPFETTDADGYATVNVKYPDNLTTWRITARVITSDTKVGQAINTVIVKKDLLVRLEAPRFMREDDKVTISAIVHNYLADGKNARVRFKAENAEIVSGNSLSEVYVSPNSEQRVDIVIRPSEPKGNAVLYAEALTNEESDAIEIKVPVLPDGLKLTKTLAADFSDETKTEVKFTEVPQFADLRSTELKLSVDPSLASTILSSLDDLIGYPYGCVEQTMSRFLPTVIVANAFEKLNAPLSDATKAEIPKMVAKGLSRLYSMQHSDGGWGWWTNDNSNPFMTAYVVYGLSIAGEAGYDIDGAALKRGVYALKNQVKSSKPDETTLAYMLYALSVSGKSEDEFVKEQLAKINDSNLNNYGRSLVALTWKQIGENSKANKMLQQLVENAVKLPGEGAAYWDGISFHYNWQDDKVQTTAMALKALVNIGESSDLKELVVRWLILQRQGTSWRSTQETAMIVYAMTDYLRYSNELDPDYSVRVVVNGNEVFSRQMTKADVFEKANAINIPGDILRKGSNEIAIEKSGKGKVYFSSSLTYYKPGSEVSAQEEGYRVEKEISVLKLYNEYGGDRITYREVPLNGAVKSGDVLKVTVKVHTKESESNYFMLEDPLPAGFEYVKDDWAYPVEGEEQQYYGNYWRWWYADRDVRDDRVTFFATYFGKGVHTFTYLMRAEIPGVYTVNPTIGSLMYYPEVYGNTTSQMVEVIE